MGSNSLVEVRAPKKTEPLSQLLDRAFGILDEGRSLDELSSFNDAGLLYEIAACIEIRVSGVVESNTFWTRVVIGQSLEECAKKGDRSIECLCHTVKGHIASHSRRTTLAAHTFVVPTRMPGIGLRSVAGLNSQLNFHSDDSGPTRLDMTAALRAGERIFRTNRMEYPYHPTLIQLEVTDLPLHQAVSEAEKEIKLLRACVNITEPSIFHIESGGKWTPSYPFPAPPFVLVFDGNGTYLDLFYEPTTLDYQRLYKTKKLTPDQLDKALELLDKIKLLSPSVQEALLRPLLLYQDALDLPFPQLALFGMWRALEAFLHLDTKDRLSYDKLIKTVSALFGPGTPSARGAAAILQAIKGKRNDYIHLAKDQGIDNMDCSWLRFLLRRILLGLINKGHEFKDSQTLLQFLTHYRLGKEDLVSVEQEAVGTLEAIEAIRKARKL
jgi:hypothetical protein